MNVEIDNIEADYDNEYRLFTFTYKGTFNVDVVLKILLDIIVFAKENPIHALLLNIADLEGDTSTMGKRMEPFYSTLQNYGLKCVGVVVPSEVYAHLSTMKNANHEVSVERQLFQDYDIAAECLKNWVEEYKIKHSPTHS